MKLEVLIAIKVFHDGHLGCDAIGQVGRQQPNTPISAEVLNE